jgi:hypothetical protein
MRTKTFAGVMAGPLQVAEQNLGHRVTSRVRSQLEKHLVCSLEVTWAPRDGASLADAPRFDGAPAGVAQYEGRAS